MRYFLHYLVLFCLISCVTQEKKAALSKAPPAAHKNYALAEKQFQAKKWRAAEKNLTNLINQYRNTEVGDDSLFLLAKIYHRQEMWKRSFNVYESVYESKIYSPREFVARYSAARILTYKVNRPQQALKLISKSLKRKPSPSNKAKFLEVRYDALVKSGSQLEALETLATLSETHPNPAKREAFKNKAKSFMDSRLSGPELKDFADGGPDSRLKTDAMYRYGVLMLEQGEYSEARSYLENVISEDPKSYIANQAQGLLQQLKTDQKVNARTIGVLLPLSGKYASMGYQALYGLQLALGIQGGMNSNSVRLAVVDSQGKGEIARRGIKKLARENHSIAIIGGLLGKTAYAASIQAQELGVPFLALSQKEGLTDIGPFIFRNALTIESQLEKLVTTAIKELKVKRFGILYPNDNYGTKLSNRFWKIVSKNGGQVTAAQSYLPGETDFKETIQKLVGTYYVEDRQNEYQKRLKEWYDKNGGPNTRKKVPVSLLPPIVDFEALFIPDGPKAIGQIAPMLAYNDINNVILVGTNIWNSKEFLRRGQNFVSRSLFTDGFFPKDQAYINSEFYKNYLKIHNRAPTSFALQGYDGGLILRKILESGTESRIDFSSRLKDQSSVSGAIGKLQLNPKKEFLRSVMTLTVHKGQIVPFRKQIQ